MTDWFEIRVPRSTKWQPQLNATFMQALFEHINSWLDLQLVCTHQQIRWILASGDENALSHDTVQTLASSYFPGAEVLDPGGWGIEMPYQRRSVILARSDSHYFETFASVLLQKGQDPFATMVGTLDHLKPDEVLTYHVFISDMLQFTEEGIFDLLTQSARDAGYEHRLITSYNPGLAELIGAMIGKGIADKRLEKERVWRYEERDVQRYLAKLGQKLAEVNVYLRFDSPHQERLKSLSDTIAALKNMTLDGVSFLVDGMDKSGRVSTEEEDGALWPGAIIHNYLALGDGTQASRLFPREPLFVLTADEVASLWHLPHEQFTASSIQWTQLHVPLPVALQDMPDGILLGHNNGQLVMLPLDAQTQHALLIGKTGTGKSSTLQQMVAQYLERGQGFCIVDPAGSLVSSVLRYLIPAGREDDVVVLDLNDLVYPAPLSPLYRPDGFPDEAAVSMLMSVMAKVDKDMAFREMSDTLHMALRTLVVDPEANLLDVQRLFEDDGFRQRMVVQADDFTVTAFWNRFDSLSAAKQHELARPVLRRLNAFYRNKALRAVVCHPQPLDLRQLVSEGKIILVSLATDETRMPFEQRQLLGAMLVSQIQMAAMAGAIQNPPFMLVIDEAQHFVTTALDTMLSESRKHGLGLVLSNQYTRQLTGSTLDAIEGNVGTLISFEVGDTDAGVFAPYMKPEFQQTGPDQAGAVSGRGLDPLPPCAPAGLHAGDLPPA